MAARPPTSNLAILDVRRGRALLERRVHAGESIPVVIHGVIDGLNSHDDGISIEFTVDVTKLEWPDAG